MDYTTVPKALFPRAAPVPGKGTYTADRIPFAPYDEPIGHADSHRRATV